jgi:hypothetical protein
MGTSDGMRDSNKKNQVRLCIRALHTSGGDVGEVECESGSSRGELDAVAVEGILERVEIRDHNDVADRQRHQLGRVISVACE